jgi:hypothetical protein
VATVVSTRTDSLTHRTVRLWFISALLSVGAALLLIWTTACVRRLIWHPQELSLLSFFARFVPLNPESICPENGFAVRKSIKGHSE